MSPPSRAKVESRNCLWTNQSYVQTATISYALLMKLCNFDNLLHVAIRRRDSEDRGDITKFLLFSTYSGQSFKQKKKKKGQCDQWDETLFIFLSSMMSEAWKNYFWHTCQARHCHDGLPGLPCAGYPGVWQMAHIIKKLKKHGAFVSPPAIRLTVTSCEADTSLDIW